MYYGLKNIHAKPALRVIIPATAAVCVAVTVFMLRLNSFEHRLSPEDIKELVETNLTVIMSSPKTSSNPQDYIDAHPDACEKIQKLGGEEARQYMLARLKEGNAARARASLRGALMIRLCREPPEARGNVTGEPVSPREGFLFTGAEMKSPDFMYNGDEVKDD